MQVGDKVMNYIALYIVGIVGIIAACNGALRVLSVWAARQKARYAAEYARAMIEAEKTRLSAEDRVKINNSVVRMLARCHDRRCRARLVKPHLCHNLDCKKHEEARNAGKS